jgi:hypothetical protein
MVFTLSTPNKHNIRDLELKYKLFETLSNLGIGTAHSSMTSLWIDYVVMLSSIVDEAPYDELWTEITSNHSNPG